MGYIILHAIHDPHGRGRDRYQFYDIRYRRKGFPNNWVPFLKNVRVDMEDGTFLFEGKNSIVISGLLEDETYILHAYPSNGKHKGVETEFYIPPMPTE